MEHQLKCFMCERAAGLGADNELQLKDFGVDAHSGTIVCKDCYTPPADNKVLGRTAMTQRGQQVVTQQGIALAKAQERAAAAARRNSGH